MTLETRTGRYVRVARASSAPAIQAIYAPIVRDTAISFEDEAPAVEEMANRITSTLPTHPYLVCIEAGDVLGYAYGGAHRARAAYRWSVDVTVYVSGTAHRRGVGRALYKPLLTLLRRQGFHGAFAGIALPNTNSVGLHEAVGFRPLGIYKDVGFKLGQWHDVGWWRLGLAEGPPQADPLPFAALQDEVDTLISADFTPQPAPAT